jgi:hypothetical protein
MHQKLRAEADDDSPFCIDDRPSLDAIIDGAVFKVHDAHLRTLTRKPPYLEVGISKDLQQAPPHIQFGVALPIHTDTVALKHRAMVPLRHRFRPGRTGVEALYVSIDGT